MGKNSIGELSLDLVVKAGAFTAGMTAAERQANKSLTAIEKRANAFGRSLGVGLRTASVAAFGALSAGMGIYIRNTIEAEKVQAQLAARIKDTGAAAGRSLSQLSAQADKLQSMTIFDDEAIGEAQAMLLTFKEIQGVQFDKTIESALDLATVMGTDATQAAKLLGRALSDPEKGLTALTRAGVVFTDAERDQIKAMVEAGEKAKAQDAILAKLQGTMGTAAEAARNTLGGAFTALKNAADNVLEGDSGNEGVRGLTDAVNDLTDTLNDPQVKNGVDTIATGIARIASECVQGISLLAQFGQNLSDVFDISDKIASGAGPGAFSDRQLDIRMANLQEQITKARKAGDKAEEARLVALRQEAQREFTKRALRPDFSDVTATVSSTYDKPTTDGTGGGRGRGGSRSAKPSNLMDDWLTEDREKLQQMAEAAAQANEQFLDMSATYAGPLAVAEREHIKNLVEIAETGREAGRSAEEITALQAKATDAYNEQVAAIRAQKSPAEELIDSLQEEIKWLGATTEEQLKLNAARAAGKGATEQQIEDIYGLMKARQEAQQQADIWNDVERDLSDTFVDLVGNIGDAGNILKDFADRVGDLITRSIADDWANSITDWFKSFSSSGASASGSASASGGASGGGIVDWFSALFSGGMASGGPVQPWSMYEVNEQGMEGLSVGGRDYLLTGSRGGYITPANQMGGRNISQTFVVQGAPDRRTREQMARESGIAARRALMRTG